MPRCRPPEALTAEELRTKSLATNPKVPGGNSTLFQLGVPPSSSSDIDVGFHGDEAARGRLHKDGAHSIHGELSTADQRHPELAKKTSKHKSKLQIPVQMCVRSENQPHPELEVRAEDPEDHVTRDQRWIHPPPPRLGACWELSSSEKLLAGYRTETDGWFRR